MFQMGLRSQPDEQPLSDYSDGKQIFNHELWGVSHQSLKKSLLKGLKSTTKFYFENLSTESSIGKSVEEKRIFKRRFGFGENTPTRRLLGYVIVCHVNYAVSEPCLICLTYSFRCYSHDCINKSKLCSKSLCFALSVHI